MRISLVLVVLNALTLGCASTQQEIVATNVEIASGTTRLELDESVQAPRMFNGVRFEIDERARRSGTGRGFRLSDDTLVTPRVEVIDTRGKHYVLHDVSYGKSSNYHYFALYSRSLPRDAEFVTLLIQSDAAFRTPHIMWVSWDPK